MKKVIYILVGVIVTAVFTVGSTVAFFVDKEVVQDNLLQAGALDIGVDSKSRYRELVCADDFWTNPGVIDCEDTVVAVDVLNKKAGFEPETFKKENKIKKNCVDFGYDYTIVKWELEDGQYIAEGSANDTLINGDGLKADWESEIETAGVIRKSSISYTDLRGGYSGSVYEYCFLDKKYTCHDISFVELCGNFGKECGNCVLDTGEECDNSLNVLDGFYCTDDCQLEPLEPCVGTWEETDLEEDKHKFFNFVNIKPGDYGANTISLHAFDNDAWGTLLIGDVASAENTCTDPEYFDEPDCDLDEEGELLEKIYFYAWLDEGAIPGWQNTGREEGDDGFDLEEGDSIKQAQEMLFRETDILNTKGEEWDISPVLATTYADHCASGFASDGRNNGNACHGLAQDGRLVGGVTYYLGLGWEFLAERNNSTQSDSFSFDMTLGVEQWRHNENPFE